MNHIQQVDAIINVYIQEYGFKSLKEEIEPFLNAINHIDSVDNIIHIDFGIGNYKTTSPAPEKLDTYIFEA